MADPRSSLLVAQSPALADVLARLLADCAADLSQRRVETAEALRAALQEEPATALVAVAVADDGEAQRLTAAAREHDPDLAVLVLGTDHIAGGPIAGDELVVWARRDDTETLRRELARALALSDARRSLRSDAQELRLYAHALAEVREGIVIADGRREGFPTVYVNPAFEQLTGWPASAVLGQSCALLQGADTDPGPVRELADALREGRPTTVTLRNHRRDGSTFWNEVSLSPLRDDHGAVSHVVGVLGDVTARVERAEALRAAEAARADLAASLDDADARHRELLDALPVVVMSGVVGQTPAMMSGNVGDLFGHAAAEFLADPQLWHRLVHADDHDRVASEFEEYRTERRAEFDCEYRVRRPDGTIVHVWERATKLPGRAWAPVRGITTLMDVTALRRTELALRAERDRAERFLDLTGTIIMLTDLEGRITMINRAARELLGYDETELLGSSWLMCLPLESHDRALHELRQLIAGASGDVTDPYEGPVLAASGEVRTITWRASLLRDEAGEPTGVLRSGLDITERLRAEEQLSHLAYHDPVTGLPNRALLHEHLELALARARRADRAVALLYLDLDEFKLVNDSFGHEAGDELLRSVASRLAGRRRATDLLARHGGDEFLLLISDIEHDALRVAEVAAEGMLGALAEPFDIQGEQFNLAASIGVSIFPLDAGDAATLLRHADAAMYQAKASGRSGVKSYESAGPASLERLSMTTRLRRAAAEDELLLHWQPIVDPASGELHALEALVRWDDPERGRISPAQFIPIAEETGLIERIGEWVAEAICRQRIAWRAQGIDPAVSLNVSARELRRGDLAERLLALHEHHGLDPAKLIVEITETTAMHEHERTLPLLERLAQCGMRVAIDDFGAGYSSLSRLRALPVGLLKLDRSFLAGVPSESGAAAVVAAVLELSAALGMQTVVEGVETEDQRGFLVAHGCPLAQGFLLARPVPADELGPILRPGGAGARFESARALRA